jgi:hypothetical protein
MRRANAQARFNETYSSPLEGDLRYIGETLTAPDAEPVLTLVDVQLLPMAGDGLEIPAVRLPFGAITAWWISSATVLRAGSTGGWGVGVLFPLGN